MVTVELGTQADDRIPRSFSIHTALVIRHSDFFRAAMVPGAWRLSKGRVVRFSDGEPEIFEIFYWFLYTGRIHSAHGTSEEPQ